MPPDYGNSNPLPSGYTLNMPDGTYTYSQPPVYVDPNYQSLAFGLISIAQAIQRLADVLERLPPAKTADAHPTEPEGEG